MEKKMEKKEKKVSYIFISNNRVTNFFLCTNLTWSIRF